MSKKSKKKFNKVEVQWQEDDTMLPTVAAAIPSRRDRSFGGGRDSFGGRDSYSNSRSTFDDTERGPWRRGPSSSGPPQSFNSSSFNSRRDRGPSRDSGPSSFSNFRSRDRDNNDFRSRDRDNNDFRSRDNNEMKPQSADMIGASENDTNWRFGKKKEQPKISLNSKISSTSNVNPWRNNNNNNNNDTQRGPPPRGGPPSNNTFSRNSFGSRSAENGAPPSREPRPNRYGGGGFGGGSRGGSKFGGGGFGGGAASKSKFNTGGGFAASALKNIDSGGTRLTYSKNNRFSGIMDEPKRETNRESVSLQAPSKVSSSRFGAMMKAPPVSQAQDAAFPGLSTANGMRQREEKTIEQMKAELQKDDELRRSAAAEKEKKKQKQQQVQLQKGQKQKQVQQQKKQKQQQQKEEKKQPLKQKVDTQQNKQQQQKKNQNPKVDKKLVRQFNKEFNNQKKGVEINADTERMILFGLSQRDNVLKRNSENYEKVATLLVGVILNPANTNRRNKKQKVIDLALVYDIIYNKTQLFDAKKECLALVLEILSLIEMKKTCLAVVEMINRQNVMRKYLSATPNITNKKAMTEFDEYGLQYVYPLSEGIASSVKQEIENKISLKELVAFLQLQRKKQMVYSNYVTLDLCVTYIVNTFYFAQCVEDEESNEEIAKQLILSQTDGAKKKTKKSDFAQIIELLCFKQNDDDDKNEDDEDDDGSDEEEEEEEVDDEDEDEVDSHSLLIFSSIISCSAKLNNNHRGLVSVLKIMELARLIKYDAIQKFIQCDDDKWTENRLSALSKLTDWIADLDARQARIDMEKDNDDYDDEEHDNDYIGGNLLAQRKHKTAADYEQISYVDVE